MYLVLLVLEVSQDRMAIWVCQDLREETDLLEQMVVMVEMERLDLRDLEESLDQWVLPVLLDRTVVLIREVHVFAPVFLDVLGLLDLPVEMGQMVVMVVQVLPVLLVEMDAKVLLVEMVHLE